MSHSIFNITQYGDEMLGFGLKRKFKKDVMFGVQKIYFLAGNAEIESLLREPLVRDLIDATYEDKDPPSKAVWLIASSYISYKIHNNVNSDNRELIINQIQSIARKNIDEAAKKAISGDMVYINNIMLSLSPLVFITVVALVALEYHCSAAKLPSQYIVGTYVDVAASILGYPWPNKANNNVPDGAVEYVFKNWFF
jgi:hypothetical protein